MVHLKMILILYFIVKSKGFVLTELIKKFW